MAHIGAQNTHTPRCRCYIAKKKITTLRSFKCLCHADLRCYYARSALKHHMLYVADAARVRTVHAPRMEIDRRPPRYLRHSRFAMPFCHDQIPLSATARTSNMVASLHWLFIRVPPRYGWLLPPSRP